VSDGLRARLLQRFPLFTELPPALLDELVAGVQEIRVPAGTVLFDERQPCAGFPLVLDGDIRVTKAAPSGRGILLYRVAPGEGCILSGGCLLGNQDYSASGVAETDVVLLRIPPALFQTLMVQSEPFRRFVFAMYGERLAEVMQLVEAVAFQRLDARLAQLLIRRGPVLHATHQSLANELGSVREIVSRLLRSFEDRGWVRLEREKVTLLDLKALAAQAQGA
jgi:CRP/FNR family transcriptional regulator